MELTSCTNELFTALVAAQENLKDPAKSKAVSAGPMKYRYTPLEAIMPHVRRVLREHGLALVQGVSADGQSVLTTLGHKSGQHITTSVPIVGDRSNAQKFGASLSYARRYAVLSMLGITPDGEDDDANDNSGNSASVDSVDHPTWAVDKRSFAQLIVSMDIDDRKLFEVCREKWGKTPNEMSREQREKLVEYTVSEKGAKFRAEVSK